MIKPHDTMTTQTNQIGNSKRISFVSEPLDIAGLLLRMMLAYVGVDVVGVLRGISTVGALELRRDTALVPEMSDHIGLFGVAVVATWTVIALLNAVDVTS